MTDRERLVEHIGTFCKGELGANFNKDILDKFADHILADGWIRPPCKVGDVVTALCVIIARITATANLA